MSLTVFALVLLAVARVTRLVTTDTLTEGIRQRVAQRFGPDSALAYLVRCDWCAGVWVAAPAAVALHLAGALPDPAWLSLPATWMALSLLASLLVQAIDTALAVADAAASRLERD